MSHIHNGEMTVQREYTCWCARCDTYEDFYESHAGAAKQTAVHVGWKKLDEGWVCSSCMTAECLEAEAKANHEGEVKDGEDSRS